MPMSASYKERLFPVVEEIATHYGTPFHLYDETGIRETGQKLIDIFEGIKGFQEYYAVKALPNPRMLQIMMKHRPRPVIKLTKSWQDSYCKSSHHRHQNKPDPSHRTPPIV